MKGYCFRDPDIAINWFDSHFFVIKGTVFWMVVTWWKVNLWSVRIIWIWNMIMRHLLCFRHWTIQRCATERISGLYLGYSDNASNQWQFQQFEMCELQALLSLDIPARHSKSKVIFKVGQKWAGVQGSQEQIKHLFSCDNDPQIQSWILRAHKPDILIGDIRDSDSKAVLNIKTNQEAFRACADCVFCGWVCVDSILASNIMSLNYIIFNLFFKHFINFI